jgi:hypothetical protein
MLILIIMVILKFFAVSSANWFITLIPLMLIIFMKLFIFVKEMFKDVWGNISIICNNLLIILGILIVLKLVGVSELSWILTILPLIVVFILKSIFYIKNHGK